MEEIYGLRDLYEKCKERVEANMSSSTWEAANYEFDEDPPCIKALLANGVFELGTINMAQFRLAAYLKSRELSPAQAIQILDEWLLKIPPSFIYEHNPATGEVDYRALKEQNRYVVRTVYAGGHYGFSCSGIKQIPGVSDFCEVECKEAITANLRITLFDATKAENVGRRLIVPVEVVGRQDVVKIVPKLIRAWCTATMRNSDKCAACILNCSEDKPVEIPVNAGSHAIAEFIGSSKTNRVGKIAKAVGMSRRSCNRWKFTIEEQNAETIYITPPLSDEYIESERYTIQTAYFLGHGIRSNKTYDMEGYLHIDDHTNNAMLIFDDAQESTSSLELFKRTPEMKEQSMVFVPEANPLDKLWEIIDSLAYNHIKVWERNPMIAVVDLCFHSARRINFQTKLIRGWMNVLIIGDSGQAKTEVVKVLMRHYNAGYRASAESSTRAGLLWGVNVKGVSQPYLIWGVIPRNSGRLVAIDELKELIEKGGFGDLTEARSSGIVNVNTIVSGRTVAETRLIMMTNPPDRKTMSSYFFPVESVLDTIPTIEDTRRFDLVICVASKELDDSVFHRNIRNMPNIPDLYTSDICRNHILWAWSLNPDDILISPQVEQFILDESMKHCKLYSPEIPIVEPADHREKLCRISTALAIRVNSVNDDDQVVVKDEHVASASELMQNIYNSESMAYDDFSHTHAKIYLDEQGMDDLVTIYRTESWSPYGERLAEYLVEESWIIPKIMSTACGCDTATANRLMEWMAANKLARVTARGSYSPTSNGVAFVKHLLKQYQDTHAKLKKLEQQNDGGEEEF